MPVVPRVMIAAICPAELRSGPRLDSIEPDVGRFRWLTRSWVFVLVCLLGSCLTAAGSAGRLAVLQQQYQTARTQFVSELDKLAAACDESHLDSLGNELRQLQVPVDSLTNLDQLPTHVQPDIPANLPPEEHAIRVKFHKLRIDYATKLYGLARRARKEQHTSLAYRLVNEVLVQNPDHPQARELMGYQQVGSEWTTPFALRMKREKKVWHDDYGWILFEHIARYQKGERLYNGKWMTAEREETLRSNFKNGWEINTEHFHVKTNHSQERGVHLAAAVEVFHRYFMREFAAFFKTPQQLDKLFNGEAAGRGADGYDIDYYRDRQEFVNRLADRCPIAGQINGLYMPEDRRAYFFFNPEITEEESLETLYHEVTHQLLSESTLKTEPVGHSQDFWVIEGIACYFESFHVTDEGAVSVGNTQHKRIQAARAQVVAKDQEPLARFTALGMLRFQKGTTPELQRRYAQATGLAHFFLHYQDGIYRDEFIEYLTNVYSPDQRVRGTKSLEQVIGVPYATLDSQYAAYFNSMPGVQNVKANASRTP